MLDISLKQSFANSGIKQRVPYQPPAGDDDLNWKGKRTQTKKRIEDGLYFLNGKVIVCVNGKFYEI